MSALKCCLNWRVIAGLGVVASGVALLQLSWLPKLAPILLYAICPLSMGLMMWTMGRMVRSKPEAVPSATEATAEPTVTIPASLYMKLTEGDKALRTGVLHDGGRDAAAAPEVRRNDFAERTATHAT